MVAVTYGVARAPAAEGIKRAEITAPRKSLFTRFMEALMESRLQQAHREIVRHAHLLSNSHDVRGNLQLEFDLDETLPGGR